MNEMAKMLFLYIVLAILLMCLFFQLCDRFTVRLCSVLNQTAQRREQTIRDAFKGIQQKHGAVAVATDFSHFIRLNGEVCRIKDYEKPNF